MTTFGISGRWLVLWGLALATTALAQKEQWLEYHTSREGRGYAWLKLSTNPPPNLALPKFNAQPYFARWATPMDPAGGRWICFDRVRKSGPYDRVFIDGRGEGRFDAKAAINASRVDQYNAYFDPVRVVFKGEDGPITYHLVFRVMKYGDEDVRVLVSSGGYYSGLVELGGKKRRLELIDNNVNGAFNDLATDERRGDRVSVEDRRTVERYLGKLLEVDDQFYRITAARDGAFVKLLKAEDVALGQVRVPETIASISAYGENGEFTRKPAKGELSLPAGKYRVESWNMSRKDSKGAKWELTGYGANDTGKFAVVADKAATLQVGEPVYASLDATQTTNQVDFNLRFEGRLGESIQFLIGNQRPPGPKLALASPDEKFHSILTFAFG